ncbi:MAG: translation initiation factor IF-2 [Candidatus Micrarchaeota archaeon]
MSLRSPVVCILAHVDHGKTSILDYIRGSAIAKKEPGAITQMIGAYYLPKKTIVSVCGPLGATAEQSMKVPGLLFIDTPGHEAFTSMRERGGSIADIAILVIDIMQGIQPQTVESLKILKANKTPFLIALNKIDLIPGWKRQKTTSYAQAIAAQSPQATAIIDEKLYTIVGKLSEMGFESEQFNRVEDFTKQLLILPTSAKTGEGMAELLLYLAGLCQKFLSDDLISQVSGPAKGSILEVKEEKGLGTTIDVIIYEGSLSKNDLIAFATLAGPKVAKVRGLLRPPYPGEATQGSLKYVYEDEVHAAAGIKIYAPELEGALAGSPVLAVPSQELSADVQSEIKSVLDKVLVDEQNTAGVIVKTDTLGSAEALLRLLRQAGVPIKQISIGPVNKKDVICANSSAIQNKYVGAVLAFNVAILPDAQEEAKKSEVPIFNSKIIYNLLDKYQEWAAAEKAKDTSEILCSTTYPAQFLVLPNCFFRLCKPAIFGVEIKYGVLKAKAPIMLDNGEIIGTIKAIQHDGKSVEEAKAGDKVAISVEGPYAGKTFKAGDEILTYLNRTQSKTLMEKCGTSLNEQEKELIGKIMQIIAAKNFDK